MVIAGLSMLVRSLGVVIAALVMILLIMLWLGIGAWVIHEGVHNASEADNWWEGLRALLTIGAGAVIILTLVNARSV